MELLPMLFVLGLCIAAATVTALEGKPWFLLLGFVIGWFWVFGSLRVAKPHSWWARRFYEGAELAESNARFNKGGFETAPAPAFDPTRY